MTAPAATIHGVPVSWDRARELFSLDPAVAYLNHGALGATPLPVQRAQQRLRDEVEANPVAFFDRGLTARRAHVRARVAAFLGADPAGTAFVPNATAGVAVVLGSLDWRAGDEVLTTDHTYGAVNLAVRRLCERTGAVSRVVRLPLEATDDEVVARLVQAVRPGLTRLAIVDQISSPTARLFPVARIAAALRPHGVAMLVDAAHVPGMLPVDVSAIGADFWVGNLHKWAFAPRPTAVLVAAAAQVPRIEPLIVSWSQPEGYPAAVEFGGTLDYSAWLSAPTGLFVMQTLGIERIRQHNLHLVDYAQRAVAAALRVDPAALTRSDEVSMRVVPVPPEVAGTAEQARSLRERLAEQYRCEVATQFWDGRAFVRISAQIYNTEADADRLADGLSRLAWRSV
jgi:isopenicillin-N epimerase